MKKLLTLIIVFAFLIEASLFAQGNLMVTPKRIVFEGSLQKTEINLVNIGKDTATFALSFLHYNMTERGALERIKQPTGKEMFAEPYLRIFPRMVTLAPNETQIVQLQFVRHAGMKAGEYRSHLWLRNEGNPQLERPKSLTSDTNQMSVSLTAIFGLTIPVIIRAGAVSVRATLSDLKLVTRQDSLQLITMTLNRIGNISMNGKVVVDWVPSQGQPLQVGTANAGVYTNLDRRSIVIQLNTPGKILLSNGKLKVRYVNTEENKPTLVYTEQELAVR